MTGTIVALPKPAKAGSAVAPATSDHGLRRRLFAGLFVIILLVFGVGGWAATAKLSGAIIAPGLIVVDGNIKKVQHPTGGVIGEIRVKNGDRVAAGDLLLRLDDTQTRSALGIIVSQLIELTGRKARLAAERDNAEAIAFPENFESMGEDARRVAAGEQRLFDAKRRAADGRKAQLRERIGQLRIEIDGLSAQRSAKARELKLVREELARVDDMFKRQLTPSTRVLAMEREEARIDGEHGALTSQIARAGGSISEIELQILSLDQTAGSEAQRDLRDSEARLAELAERRIAAEDQLRRVDIRAPLAGLVHDLAVHTVGGVIGPGEPVMMIVPSEDTLTIEVRIAPPDIDQVTLGQKTVLRFPAFNQRTTPELAGIVTRIAADLTRESQSGSAYYLARIRVDEDSLAKLKGLKLVPGMPVEGFIETQERTALSFVLKPFTDQLARVFRED